MNSILASNILSPLGFTAAENYQAVVEGRSKLQRQEQLWDMPHLVCASLFGEQERARIQCDGLTWFESLVYRSAEAAINDARAVDPDFNLSDEKTVFILGTTKANVGNLDEASIYYTNPAEAAERVAKTLGITTRPIVACNACISGLSAIILAHRLLESGAYTRAIVCGADVQSKFIVSGFHSLGALSSNECRPFDADRLGLNLGECAATLILGVGCLENSQGYIQKGIIRNDAYHLSSPSKTADGQFLALSEIMKMTDEEDLAFINAHGTATFFNDQMEAVAIGRANLAQIPVNALKGYYGHTMGAAGVVETILSFMAIERDVLLGTRGYEELGVSTNVKLSSEHGATEKTHFLKLLSGFGGGNAALLCEKLEGGSEKKYFSECKFSKNAPVEKKLHATHKVKIIPESVEVDGNLLPLEKEGDILLSLYKTRVADYPRFYKMDGLSRLAFVASELLLQAEGKPRFEETDKRGVLFFNRTSTIDTDKKYLRTIATENYFPSPSLFVYTLPNIAMGEIAIRNRYHGETSFYIISKRDADLMKLVQEVTFFDETIESLITGWIDYEDESHYIAELEILLMQ